MKAATNVTMYHTQGDTTPFLFVLLIEVETATFEKVPDDATVVMTIDRAGAVVNTLVGTPVGDNSGRFSFAKVDFVAAEADLYNYQVKYTIGGVVGTVINNSQVKVTADIS